MVSQNTSLYFPYEPVKKAYIRISIIKKLAKIKKQNKND
jgi:hypothetical protein